MTDAVPWRYTDDPDAPCSYCVQWACSVKEAHDDANCVYDGHEWVPVWPDGSIQPLVRNTTCSKCEKAIDDYIADDELRGL